MESAVKLNGRLVFILRLTLKHTTHNQQYDPQILANKNAKKPMRINKKVSRVRKAEL